MKLETVIKKMRKRQGEKSGREFARELGVTPAYISQIYAGARKPGPSILKAMGLVTEETIKEPKTR